MKVLVPLDGSKEAEGVFGALRGELGPDDSLVLLRIIRPAKTLRVGGQIVDASQLEESERANGIAYLQGVAQRFEMSGERCRCEVAVDNSVVQGIVDAAEREKVDRIIMYTHDRKGLAKLIKGSIAGAVQRKAPVDVSVFGPRELAGVS